MAYVVGIPLLALMAVLQATLLTRLRLLDGAPDLILLAVVAWSMAGKQRQAMVLALIGGLFLDLVSAMPLGATSLTLVLATFLVSLGEGSFWEANFLTQLAAVLVASFVFQVGAVGLLLVLGRTVEIGYALGRAILPSVFLNLLLALPAQQLAESLHRTLYPSEVGI